MRKQKIFWLTLALTMFVASGLWAQELKFDGYLNSGLGLVVTDAYKTKSKRVDPYFKAIANDAEHHGYRFRLNGSYTNADKTAGAKFRLQSQTNLGAGIAGYFSLPYAFAWANFFDKVLTVNGGIVEDSSWTTGDWWLASDSVSHFTGLGALVKITPVEGLDLGVGGYTINRNSGSNNNVLVLANLRSSEPTPWDLKWTAHGAYTLKDAFRVDLSFRSENRAGLAGAAPPVNKTDSAYLNMYDSLIYGDFRFLGYKPLTAVVATRLQAVGDEFKARGNIVISETLGYKISDELSLGVNAVQFLYNRTENGRNSGDKVDMDPSLLFNPWVSYAIDKVVPRLDVVYFKNGTSQLVATGANDRTWHRHAFANKDYASDSKGNRMSLFSVRPSVKINIDSKTFLEIGDMINFDSGDKKGAYANIDAKGGNKKSVITNALYVDLKTSF